MKKILLSIFTLAVVGITAKVEAQCELVFENLVVSVNNSKDTLVTKCKASFNASFDIKTNTGFKYLFFHSWLAADYPNPSIFDCTGSTPAVDPGTAAQLGTNVDDPGKSFLDFGFVGLKDFLALPANAGAGPFNVTSLLATQFFHDNTVVLTQPANSPGMTAFVSRKGGDTLHFDLFNINIIINQACGSTISVKTDIWGSNSNAGDPKAQCYECGIPAYFNDPTITGSKLCSNPNTVRSYFVNISTVDPTPKNVTYKVYLDADSSGAINTGDILAFTSSLISISSGTPYQSGITQLPNPYHNSQPYSEYPYIILVEGATLSNSIAKEIPTIICAPLPVDFKSFTATRNRSSVVLKWETASEKNNMGFALERNNNGTWEQIAFVNSQAAGGNSDALLTYTYNDLNNSKGITQYRIKQVDLDNKSKYSEIRSVRGLDQIGKVTVYPNPTNNGTVNVVFDDASVIRTISVLDMSGRTLKQINNISNNNITIDNLQPGMYTLRIMVPATGEQTVQKIVVNKR